jgi:hypothetical protein
MPPDLLGPLKRLSDPDLVARLEKLAAAERDAVVSLVAHLAELDTRDAHLRAGHGSLFGYCRDALAFSEQEAYNRVAGARAARRFPVVLEMLESGDLNLTTVRLLASRLTPDNYQSALESARGKSKLQVEELAARLWPRPDAPSFVRKLPTLAKPGFPAVVTPVPGLPPRTSGPEVGPRLTESRVPPPSADPVPSMAGSPQAPSPPAAPLEGTTVVGPPWIAPRRPADVTPLAPDRYKVQITIGGETLEKLRRAKDLLRHAIPSGDEAAILDRALTALLAAIAQRKFAATETPRASAGTAARSRHIPAEVRRAVWRRDLGRCAFVGTKGRRCAERGFLEFHHVRPYAAGGEATVKNIQLRCRSHNGLEARAYFGPAQSPESEPNRRATSE